MFYVDTGTASACTSCGRLAQAPSRISSTLARTHSSVLKYVWFFIIWFLTALWYVIMFSVSIVSGFSRLNDHYRRDTQLCWGKIRFILYLQEILFNTDASEILTGHWFEIKYLLLFPKIIDLWVPDKQMYVKVNVADPCHFGTDPEIRGSVPLALLFSSLTFKTPIK
jgi:hypothetical protein